MSRVRELCLDSQSRIPKSGSAAKEPMLPTRGRIAKQIQRVGGQRQIVEECASLWPMNTVDMGVSFIDLLLVAQFSTSLVKIPSYPKVGLGY